MSCSDCIVGIGRSFSLLKILLMVTTGGNQHLLIFKEFTIILWMELTEQHSKSSSLHFDKIWGRVNNLPERGDITMPKSGGHNRSRHFTRASHLIYPNPQFEGVVWWA